MLSALSGPTDWIQRYIKPYLYHILSLTDCLQHIADEGDIRLLMSEHPYVMGVSGDSSAYVEGAENSTQLSLIKLVLQNCVSAWKRTVDSYGVVRRANPSAPHPLVVIG